MAPLPPHPPAFLMQRPNFPNVQSAYDKCLLAEKHFDSQPKSDPGKHLALVCVRIVGYIIHHAPSAAGVTTISREVISCRDHDKLRDLGSEYLRAWMRAFRSPKGRTPTPSNHSSRPSFDTLADMLNDTLETAPQSHASAKRAALARDGFRCMITKRYDRDSLRNNLELQNLCLDYDDTTMTQCAHIFSESTNSDIEPGSDKRQWAASMWAVMSRSGYEKLPDELNGPGIHRLQNILTLDPTLHTLFDSLGVWFVPADVADWEEDKHIYKVEVTPDNNDLKRRYPKVTFTSTRKDLPLPAPEYLAIHAACCTVAHLSGASEWFQEFEDDQDEHLHKTLANDGTSVDFLYNALSSYALTGSAVA